MTAADRAVWIARIESLRGLVTKANLIIAAAVVLALGLYFAGRARGEQLEKDRAFARSHQALVDTIKVVETRYVRDTVKVRVTAAKADTARARFDTAAAKVEAIADTSATVPSNLVLPALHACGQAIQADTIAYRAQAAALTDMTTDRDLWKARAELDETNMPKAARIGFKSGVAAGAAIVALIVHFVR
jgi:hypothetical protein